MSTSQITFTSMFICTAFVKPVSMHTLLFSLHSLHDRPFKQCVAIIRRECQFSAPKELSFFRLQKDGACAKEEHKEGGAKSPFYSAYSKRVLSALKDRTELDMDVAREFSKLVSAVLSCSVLGHRLAVIRVIDAVMRYDVV